MVLLASRCLLADLGQEAPRTQLVIEVVSEDLPLPGASVVVNGQAAVSNHEGRATFDIAAGEYDVLVEAPEHLASRRV